MVTLELRSKSYLGLRLKVSVEMDHRYRIRKLKMQVHGPDAAGADGAGPDTAAAIGAGHPWYPLYPLYPAYPPYGHRGRCLLSRSMLRLVDDVATPRSRDAL